MFAVRLARTVFLAFLLSFGALAGAQAQDAFQRFEKEIKPNLDAKSFSYDKGAAAGDKGFTLEGVKVVIPASEATGGKPSTVKIDKVTVEQLDFDRLDPKKDELPRFAKLKLEGVSGDEDLGALLVGFGIPKVPADISLDYSFDPPTKVMTLGKLELALRGQASVALSFVLEEVDEKPSKADKAKDNTRLRTGSLVVDDKGLLAQLVPALAAQQKSTPEAMLMMAAAPLGMFAATQGTETVAALDGFASFLGDWKKPAGPLKVSITPAKSASMSDLEKIAEPNALWTRFGLKVDYAGTRAGAAGGGAAAGGAPKTATAPPADTKAPADGSKTLTGAEAWMTIIGNTVGGKIDGDEVYEYYRKDGSTVLLDGSDITKGRWTLEGERVCFKYPDEDKDCQTVSRTGDDVTFMRKGGKGYRLKVLAGNPKNL